MTNISSFGRIIIGTVAGILLTAGLLSQHALAQSGSIAGRVTDADTKAPLIGVSVRVNGVDVVSRRFGALTDREGNYKVKNLPQGQYNVTVTYLGYAPIESGTIQVNAGATTAFDAALKSGSISTNEVVVSASRTPEKITDAPASVSVVGIRQIQQRTALTVTDHLKGMQGVDIVQSGLTQSNVVTRGFNNIFSGTLTVLTDNRIAGVPSLRANIYNFIPLMNEDIEQIEIVRGPGSALYGPNTANGVMNMLTRSPFSSAGTTISVSGGERSVLQIGARHAGVIGESFGYKISAQYMQGQDWMYVDPAEPHWTGTQIDSIIKASPAADTVAQRAELSRMGTRDSSIKRISGEVRLDYVPVEDMTIIGSFGLNRAINNVDLTGIGAGQVKNWQYIYGQLRFTYKDLFLQAFLNQSDAGETYLLRTGKLITDRSWQFVTQAQHHYRPSADLHLTYGADLIITNPVTDSTITGRNENDDNTTEIGGYVQGEYSLMDKTLNLTGALRLDKSSRLEDLVLSPRAAIVYKPFEKQTFRLTYNRAFSTPGTNEQFLDIVAANVAGLFDVRASGVPQGGFHFASQNGKPIVHTYPAFGGNQIGAIPLDSVPQRVWSSLQQFLLTQGIDITAVPAPPPGSVGTDLRTLNSVTQAFDAVSLNNVADRSPVRSTITSTIELGYKGEIADRISLSIDLYRSQFKDFVGPLQTITPTVFFQQEPLQQYLFSAFKAGGQSDSAAAINSAIVSNIIGGAPGNKDLTGVPLGTVTPEEVQDRSAVYLTYRNYGDITLYGIDIGMLARITDELTLGGSLSYTDRNFFKNLDNVADLSLNSPKFKYSLSANYNNTSMGFSVEVKMRHVDGFPINSGVYVSRVDQLTGNLVPLPGYSTVDLKAVKDIPGVEGLTAILTVNNLLTFVEGSDESPFSLRHAEFIGVPAMGRLALLQLRYTFK